MCRLLFKKDWSTFDVKALTLADVVIRHVDELDGVVVDATKHERHVSGRRARRFIARTEILFTFSGVKM